MHFYWPLVKLHLLNPGKGFFSPLILYLSISLSLSLSPSLSYTHSVSTPFSPYPYTPFLLYPLFTCIRTHSSDTVLSRIHYSEYVPKTLLITYFFLSLLFCAFNLDQKKELLPIFLLHIPTSPTKHDQKAPVG
jgi:hypothetical protein